VVAFLPFHAQTGLPTALFPMSWLSDALHFLLLILLVVLAFNLMIVVHEWGHFLAARWRGLKVTKFYVWFGKPLWCRTYNGVEYGLGSIPLGGYVALPQMVSMGGLEGEENGEKLPPITALDKAIVAFAGPLFSFLLACVFAVSVWHFGKPQSEAHTTTVVGYVGKESPAAKAGIQAGDVVLSVDGDPVKRFEGLVDSVRWGVVASEGATIPFEIERAGQKMKFDLDPKAWPPVKEPEVKPTWYQNLFGAVFKRPDLRDVGLIGEMTPVVGQVQPYGPANEAGILAGDQIPKADGQQLRSIMALTEYIDAHPEKNEIVLDIVRESKPMQITVAPRVYDKHNLIKPERRLGMVWDGDGVLKVTHPSPKEQVSDALRHMGNLLTKLFSPKSDLSPAHMSGPVGVGRLYYKLFEHPDGWRMVLWFSVIFNINLAIINMLPFPLLDGGHITMAAGEAITRRPPSGAWMERIQFLCVILLFGFIAFVTLKDTGDIIGDNKPDPKWADFTTDSKPPVREWLPKDKRPAPAPAAAAPAPAR